ncbi:putative Signal peptide protein [uncultured Gammaproteobacteria bacterium]
MKMTYRTVVSAFVLSLGLAAVATPADAREVWPGELMTFQERFAMMTKMREARTPEERMRLWVSKRAELQKRADERGLILKDAGSGMMMMMRMGQEGRPEGQGMGQGRSHMSGGWGGSPHASQRPTPLISR